ncbi:MAG: hypothetical protein I8H75_04980 [Myxococcaceae bacterium]|nr:hypothetical protein [Myxococcaceae bacterium]MBH2006679.1 hypothetical protein [Myxococcaceae bacterium]
MFYSFIRLFCIAVLLLPLSTSLLLHAGGDKNSSHPSPAEEAEARPPRPARPHFVINTIYYASSDSDEPDSPVMPTEDPRFSQENFDNPPFYFVQSNSSQPSSLNTNPNLEMPVVQGPSSVSLFLRNLQNTGFESTASQELSTLGVSLLINRPFSLSERKNNFFRRILHRPETESRLSVKKTGVLWRRGQWYHKQDIYREQEKQFQWINGQWVEDRWIESKLIRYECLDGQWQQLGLTDDPWTGYRLYERTFTQRFGLARGDTEPRLLKGRWGNESLIEPARAIQENMLPVISGDIHITRVEHREFWQVQIEGQLYEGKWIPGRWENDRWSSERLINVMVDDKSVRSFYCQLKRRNPQSAKDFLNRNEKGQIVPYRWLRQQLSQHQNTRELITEARGRGAQDVYISLIDKDTLSFNRIYSGYTRLYYRNHINPPQVMSTGYVFGDSAELHPNIVSIIRPLVIGSHLDREVRSAINAYAVTCVYYPEPNTCVLVPRGSAVLPESFEDDDCPEVQNRESPALLKQVKNRTADRFWIFTDQEHPLVTEVPRRAAYFKGNSEQNRNPIEFSASSRQRSGVFAEHDLSSRFAEVSQFHLGSYQLSRCLNINQGHAFTGAGCVGTLNGNLAGLFNSVPSPSRIDPKILPNVDSRMALERGLQAAQAVVQSYRNHLTNADFFDQIFSKDTRNVFLEVLRKGMLDIRLIREALKQAESERLPQRDLVYAPQGETAEYFKELPVLGDGNCGFTAMGVDRNVAVQEVLRVLRNPAHRHFQNVIHALTAEVRENLAAVDPTLVTAIQAYEPSPEELLVYIRQTYGTIAQGGRGAFLGYGLNRTGMMAAMAYIFDVQVRVFILRANNQVQRVFEHTPETPRNNVNLLHTHAVAGGSLNHFNLLEIVQAPQVRISSTIAAIPAKINYGF